MKKTIGFSPAEIKNLVNQAILNAIEKKRDTADDEDFMTAFEKLKFGISRKDTDINQSSLKIAAYKEASKAVYSYYNTHLP